MSRARNTAAFEDLTTSADIPTILETASIGGNDNSMKIFCNSREPPRLDRANPGTPDGFLKTQNRKTKTMKTKMTAIVVALATSSFTFGLEPGGDKPEKGKGRPSGARPIPAEVLAKFDADKDGKLNAEERKAAMEARQAEMLAKFDTDKDGKLSEEEKKAAGEARKAEMMKRFDKDGDGELSDDEKKAMRAAMAQRGGDRPGPPKGDRPGKPGKEGKPGKGKKPAGE